LMKQMVRTKFHVVKKNKQEIVCFFTKGGVPPFPPPISRFFFEGFPYTKLCYNLSLKM
jgi:hypothetical protein